MSAAFDDQPQVVLAAKLTVAATSMVLSAATAYALDSQVHASTQPLACVSAGSSPMK
jgi:hypothetical protein